ncbi:tetratricopeptide repeat protein (macronuclear) [Tetrahymena thermophila SB210]|uniref:Tetratricopeptide repeat protein n=1 Tax=Tetrahymena thermophila (strain SB210) TaxID=312017 RepID=I7M093_TETTS|nr:tetratricopeptide repeat protein [Tetrahymena thermophila SB210]EAR85709.2 tetratricopeptide repeat protein [Tetrahymena thermophila SB210]|eukprot:XP_001033372.2 tetratricopeptide repeat protein [Tetrahymena thermophila SB210]
MLKNDEIENRKLQQEKQILENQLKEAKIDQLKEKVGVIERLSQVYYELDLKSEYKDFLEKYVTPLGNDCFNNSSEIMFFIGLGLFQEFKFKESELYIKRSLEVNPLNYKALNTLACIIVELNPQQKHQYIEILKQVLKIKEDYYRAHFNIATAYEDIKDFQNAEYHYKRSIELNPELFKLYYTYIYFLLSFNKVNEALKIITQIEAKFTQDQQVYDIYQLYFQCYFELNQFEISYKYALMSIKIDSEQFSGHVNSGNALFGLGQFEKAIQSIKTGIEKKLKDTSKGKDFIRCNIEYYNIGLCYLQLNQLDNALQSFEKSIVEDKSYNSSYKQIMKIYLQKQNYTGFLDVFEQSILNTQNKNRSLIASFVLDHGFQIPVQRIESFMQKMILNGLNNNIIINSIYYQMKDETTKVDYSLTSKRQIYYSIYKLLSEKYLRISQTLQILTSYEKIIKNSLQFQQKYSIWDLLID